MTIKPNNIPFIHNYCNRWCERCRFIDRCAVGSSEKLLETELKMELAVTEEERDEILMKHVADNFVETARLLKKMVEEAGLDFDEIRRDAQENPYKDPELTERQEKLKEWTKEYGMDVHNWMKNNPDLFGIERLMTQVMTQSDDPEIFIKKMEDAIEVSGFYGFFIYVKTQRACSGKQEDEFDEEEDLIQSDYNGSAKIALIAVGQSIKSWEFLLTAFPQLEYSIIGYLAQLQKISRYLLLEFPDAHKFIRPGFDETQYDAVGVE